MIFLSLLSIPTPQLCAHDRLVLDEGVFELENFIHALEILKYEFLLAGSICSVCDLSTQWLPLELWNSLWRCGTSTTPVVDQWNFMELYELQLLQLWISGTPWEMWYAELHLCSYGYVEFQYGAAVQVNVRCQYEWLHWPLYQKMWRVFIMVTDHYHACSCQYEWLPWWADGYHDGLMAVAGDH